MRFFTHELWCGINSTNESTRKSAEAQWRENDNQYEQHFTNIEKHLSPVFVKEFISRYGLHDYNITGIYVKKRKTDYSCEIRLKQGRCTATIRMNDLKAIRIGVETFDYCMRGGLEWGYSEFDVASENGLQLDVLCNAPGELHFEFESIEFV